MANANGQLHGLTQQTAAAYHGTHGTHDTHGTHNTITVKSRPLSQSFLFGSWELVACHSLTFHLMF